MATANEFRVDYGRSSSNSQAHVTFSQPNSNVLPVRALPAASVAMTQNPNTVFQQIHDVSSKRISTLDYMKKVHDGRVYWYNTMLFTRADLARIPYFDSKKLARRATNYLLLGLSLPAVLDLNTLNPQEYLRALNALLAEFESYQQVHPPEGASASSLSRARIPQMFKRAAHTSTKGRRTSSATDIGFPIASSDLGEHRTGLAGGTLTASTSSSFPPGDQDLQPGEEYNYLVTPSLPFSPDFFETFSTLCDILIECYTRTTNLIPSPATVAPGTGEIFAKADARLRKVILAGVIKEFEDVSRSGARVESANLSKVVLGGLM